MHAESSFSHLDFSTDQTLKTMSRYLKDSNRICFLAWSDEEPVGIIAAYASDYYFSKQRVSSDIAWFVSRKKRGSTIGIRLLSAYEKWAKDQGVSEVRMGIETGVNVEAFDSLMKKRGYDCVGRNYRLEMSNETYA